ncbi:MAG: precorrin-3B C(17)-methyltransferase [Rhodospirillales bacterium]
MTGVTAIIVLDQAAVGLAEQIRAVVPGARIHGLVGRVTAGVDQTFEVAPDHLRGLFTAQTTIVGVCAAGILIRSLAPVLGDKGAEPPVIAVAGDGSTVVPLLGGHHGANQLAATIAGVIGGAAAITTASDTRLGVALDDPPAGWRLENPASVKDATARLLAGAQLLVEGVDPVPGWLTPDRHGNGSPDRVRVYAGPETVEENQCDLVYRPQSLVVGVGCERNCDPAELRELVLGTLADNKLSRNAIACVVSLDLKADEPAVHALAAHLGVPARFFPADALEAEAPRLVTPSDVVFNETGCHGVSEGAALAAVGAAGELIVPKCKSVRATCAIARAPDPIDGAAVGHPRGRLAVVGIGPGQAGWRTPEVSRQLAAASDVVGYGLYLDLVDELIAGKTRHHSELAEEEARVRKALDLAAEGRSVALVCSGDAGIYALATLVFELLDHEDRADWNRVEVSVSPGVSAIQAAAARIGAPIGHDFCTISLSDLLTPWDAIVQRLEGAAHADFVVALYNPVSKRRRHQIEAARDILLTGRPADTPVVLARNLGRPGETIDVIRLTDLGPDSADMLTLVLIGNSQSRLIERGGRAWVYTPRGYAAKFDIGPDAKREKTGS